MEHSNFVINSIAINSIILENYAGKTYDISDMVSEINLYESIYTNCINGTVNVVDSFDFPQFLPIVGEETIYIDAVMPGDEELNSIVLSFRVYRIADRIVKNDKVQTYTLWFTSAEMMTNFETRVSKSWQTVSVNKVIEDIFTQYLKSTKPLVSEKTIGLQNYVAPAIHPFNVINYLASNRSINADRLADFLFFEQLTPKGTQFVFASLGSLLQSDPMTVFTNYKLNVSNRPMILPMNVEKIEFKKSIDSLESKASGLYNQSVIFYDHLRKKFVISKTNHEDIFSDLKKFHVDGDQSNPMYSSLKRNPMEFLTMAYVDELPDVVSDNTLSNVYNKIKEPQSKRSQNEYIRTSGDQQELNTSTLRSKVIAKRTVLLQEYENNKLFVKDLSGNLSYTVGKTVYFDFPHVTYARDTAIEETKSDSNIHISGNYLITKVRHRIVKHKNLNYEYKCHLEIAKNSFKESVIPK